MEDITMSNPSETPFVIKTSSAPIERPFEFSFSAIADRNS